jgi:hypothetical protein
VFTGAIGRRAYLAALVALLVFTAGGAFSNGLFFISQPYQINYGEGLAAWQAAHVTDLARAYAPIDRYPFVVFQYPPLYHLATQAVGAIGTTTGDLLMAGRSVSVLSAALLCILVGWITFQALPHRADWRTRLLAAAFAGALPTALYNFNWTWLARVDTLAILLSFSGVTVFAARPTLPALQILAAVLMTAGLFTRQTALPAPLACLLVAFVIDRKIALRMLLTMGLLGGLVLGWLAWRTHGQILLHLFRYNQTAFSIRRAVFGILMNTRHVAGLLVLAGGASLGVLRGSWALARGRRWDLLGGNLRANGYRRRVFLLAVYSMLAALSALTFGKEGSDINYFLEWNVSLAPLAGILLFRAAPPAGSRVRLRPVWLAALAIPLLLLDTGFNQARDGWLRILDGPLRADREQMDVYRKMLATVEEAPGPVFSEDMNLLYKTGKDVPAEPAIIQFLAKAGMWDERPFVRMIQEHRFSLVVTEDGFSGERYSPAVATAIQQAYEQAARIGDYLIYRPRPGVSQRP